MNAPQMLPIPSQLSPDASDWVRQFALTFRDEIARPLFGAASAEEFGEVLDELLIQGAALRLQWLSQLHDHPPEEAEQLVDDLLRPPPRSVLMDLQTRAAALLGDTRSFQLQRALSLTFSDTIEISTALQHRWRETHTLLRQLGPVTEAVAPHDVLALAWMMVLFGDIPEPKIDVADAAMTHLLQRTAARLQMLRASLAEEPSHRPLILDDGGLSSRWLERHPTLLAPLISLIGLALDDPRTGPLTLVSSHDPEEDLDIVELHVHTADPADVLENLEVRALRAGILGVLCDHKGGMIVILCEGNDVEL